MHTSIAGKGEGLKIYMVGYNRICDQSRGLSYFGGLHLQMPALLRGSSEQIF
jgi:hypothetical protein